MTPRELNKGWLTKAILDDPLNEEIVETVLNGLDIDRKKLDLVRRVYDIEGKDCCSLDVFSERESAHTIGVHVRKGLGDFMNKSDFVHYLQSKNLPCDSVGQASNCFWYFESQGVRVSYGEIPF